MSVSSPDRPVVVIVGGTGGVGSALARRLQRDGARVVLAARGEERLRALARELDCESAPLDATDFDATGALMADVARRHGRLDGAVNCAGSVVIKAAHRTSDDELETVMSDNVYTAFSLVRSVSRAMRGGGGSVVLVSSAAALIGIPNHEMIAAAKGAVASLARSAAATYATQNIRVNAVAPGLLRTPGSAQVTASATQLEASRSMHPLGRIGEPEEVASLIAWLLGPDSTWVTGQIISIDGGLASARERAQR